MVVKKSLFGLLVINSVTVFSLTSCGSGYYDNYPEATYYQTSYNQSVQNFPSASPSGCSCTCPNATPTPVVGKTKKKPKATTSATPTTNTVATPKPTITPTVSTDTPAEKGRKALDKVLAYLVSGNAFQATIQKYEKNLSSGKEQTQKIKALGKKPNKVFFEVLEHSTSSVVGARVSFVRGSGKAMVRPGGALKFITKELNITDSNITTPNNYSPEQVDFFGLNERLSKPSYKAEISGKTTLNGKDVYLLKVSSTTTNELDSKISYEIIGFDPSSFQPLLWEAYTDASSNAYMRTVIESFSVLNDLADSSFNV